MTTFGRMQPVARKITGTSAFDPERSVTMSALGTFTRRRARIPRHTKELWSGTENAIETLRCILFKFDCFPKSFLEFGADRIQSRFVELCLIEVSVVI
jgi:hypothetical protein